MIIKNYKELCSILDIKETTGGAKKNQLKDLELYCKYDREGNKYIIKEVYKDPVISIGMLKQTKYIKQISNIIIEYLHDSANIEPIPLFKLLDILGIANSNYEDVNRYRKEYSQIKDIHIASVYYFYSNTKTEFKRIVETCLNNLRKRRILNWSTCTMIIDGNTNTVYKADKETESLIIDTEYLVLNEMKIENMYELMKDRKAVREFNKLVSLETGGLTSYTAYDLTIGRVALSREYENIQKAKGELNTLIINKVDRTFDKDKFRKYDKEYKLLIDTLININNKDSKLLDTLKEKRKENKDKYDELKKDMDKCIDIYANKHNNNDEVIW